MENEQNTSAANEAAAQAPRAAQPTPSDAATSQPQEAAASQAASRTAAQPQEVVAPQESSQAAAQPPAFKVILASGSPRRRELLEKAGVRFTVHAADVDETLEPDQLADPPEACKKLAERKAGAVVQEILADPAFAGMLIVLGADTMVVHKREIFGKPRNLSDAKRMLRALSGDTHQVVTAVSVWMVATNAEGQVSLGFRTFADTADVTFHELTDERIADYLRQGESFDKAGAYAAQGEGAKLIKRIEGDRDTVIGLPVTRLLREFPDLAAAR